MALARLVLAATLPSLAVAQCVPGEGLPFPSTPFEHNGAAWGQMCVNKDKGHFFGIGDWGGTGEPGDTWTNPGVVSRRKILPQDKDAQGTVAREVKRQAALSDPDYVLAVGDNFYPGGIAAYCSNSTLASTIANIDYTKQFATYHDNMYAGEGLDGKPWLGCLGNHDYGGIYYNLAWDVQIYRTWTHPSSTGTVWRMPAQFWSQRIVYTDFTVDVFILESNFFDAKPRHEDPNHNMCGHGDPPAGPCYGVTPTSCSTWFRDNWDKSSDFLKKGLAASDATWKLVQTHYPGPTIAGLIATQSAKIDLIITGHTHFQSLGSTNGIDWVITGGGGGVTSDSTPVPSGEDDAYGFVDFTISKSELKMDMYSWGGPPPGRAIIRNSKTINPKTSKKFTKDMLAGIRDQTTEEAWSIWNNGAKYFDDKVIQV